MVSRPIPMFESCPPVLSLKKPHGVQVTPTGQEASEGCLICLESYPEGNAAKRLPCSHIFCHSCIRTWLTNHRSCPVCRFEFPDKETHLIIPK